MDRLKGLALGLLMCLIAHIVDRSLENATRHTTLDEGEAGTPAGIPPSRNQRTSHLKEGQMRKSLMWYINCVLLILVFGMFSCAVTGCAPRRNVASTTTHTGTTEPEPAIVLTPNVQNNLDFLYFAIADKGGLEASFCMLGWADARTRTALISRITPVWVDSADNANLHHRPSSCTDSTTVGIVHFHPDVGYCELSDVDIVSAHYLRWPSTAIVCREHADSLPRFVMVFRPDFDRTYANLPKGEGGEKAQPRTFTATYRYRRPP